MAKKKTSIEELPEEVVNEIVTAPVIEVVEAPKVEAKPAKVETKAPGMYYKGQRIDKVITKLGKTWAVAINGKREKVLKSEIEIIK